LNISEGTSVSGQTVKRVAEEEGYRKRIKRKKPWLPPHAVEKRKKWVEENEGQDWKREIWTDECTVEKYDPHHFTADFHGSRVVVPIWGAIAYNHKWPLFRIPI
ncbi:hypothetical protein TREMEDRAFT_19613, partial [Tremella mesenterica DSM 1558]|uniref:uncharacterized protein n=1 Tax=Tremella mesenterica (strain ATCC 24925 / CBS 8224 / DSM 1558 / NBRC 9311 / NRRL Y-6157 / RJB 2259-6 / UBC 559-6) TaxID=578456 RepID=UPI0003F4973E